MMTGKTDTLNFKYTNAISKPSMAPMRPLRKFWAFRWLLRTI